MSTIKDMLCNVFSETGIYVFKIQKTGSGLKDVHMI